MIAEIVVYVDFNNEPYYNLNSLTNAIIKRYSYSRDVDLWIIVGNRNYTFDLNSGILKQLSIEIIEGYVISRCLNLCVPEMYIRTFLSQ